MARSTALPLYLQISEILIREIAAGRLVDGQRLPPERIFAQECGTTVRTLRKSLAELERRGLLTRVQGSGNYIKAGPDVDGIYSLFRLELRDGCGLPTATFLSVELREKGVDLPSFGPSVRGTRFRRLRFLDETPIAIEEMWLDAAAGVVETADLSDSLYLYYKQHLGLTIARVEDRVSIAAVPKWRDELADQLAVYTPKVGEMVGYVERFSWPDGVDAVPETAMEFSRTWFDPARAHYVQRFK